MTARNPGTLDTDTVIVGAGISGIGAAIELDRRGLGSSVILEQASDLGGTWRDNTYPGVAVDIPSISYSFSFELDYPWSRSYAPGAEILDYVRHCAKRYGVADRIRYGARVVRAEFDDTTHTWTVSLQDDAPIRCRFLIAATGILSQPRPPSIDGIHDFSGQLMHTARWDHGVSLASKRVGVVGTGASAVQVVPAIVGEVSSLAVFQRTPIWVGPRPDKQRDPGSGRSWRDHPAVLRGRRLLSETVIELGTWGVVNYQRHPGLVRRVERAHERYMRSVVDDPELQDALIPQYGFGCKRPAFSNEYLECFNQKHVDLVTTSIERITPKGILTCDGRERLFDAIILATGFKTLERGNAPSFEIVGPTGVELGDFWERERYQAYSGVSVAGFPNLFLTSGPFSGGFNWYSMLDAHLTTIARCMTRARKRGATRVDVGRGAHDRYVREMRDRSQRTVFTAPACVASNSYYIDDHGDASLPFPRTPWWRNVRVRLESLAAYQFRALLVALAALASFSQPAQAQDEVPVDAVPGAAPLQEGDIIGLEQIDRLRPYLPPEVWNNRDFMFHDGMRLEIGPSFRDYSPAQAYQTATEEHHAKARLGPDGSLENYVAGQPFPMDAIDCKGDPDAGLKIIWNFDYRWQGTGIGAHGYYSYWDRGEELPLFYEGTAKQVWLAHRPEPEYAEDGGDLFRGETRKLAYGVEVLAPFDAKGITLLSYRYKSADGPRAEARNDDTWVYVPSLRRVRRISTAQRTDAVSGTDFTFDDFNGFFGIPTQYEWDCLETVEVLAPMNSQVKAYPYTRDHNFGPYGLSFADDRWELRKAFRIRFRPKNSDHPYSSKVMYIDINTAEPLYSFAFDQKEELWKIIYHNSRWSEDGHEFYEPWDGVDKPRDLVPVADIVINVQTGTGNRIEFWDANGSSIPSKGKIRRYIDVGRLTRGR